MDTVNNTVSDSFLLKVFLYIFTLHFKSVKAKIELINCYAKNIKTHQIYSLQCSVK